MPGLPRGSHILAVLSAYCIVNLIVTFVVLVYWDAALMFLGVLPQSSAPQLRRNADLLFDWRATFARLILACALLVASYLVMIEYSVDIALRVVSSFENRLPYIYNHAVKPELPQKVSDWIQDPATQRALVANLRLIRFGLATWTRFFVLGVIAIMVLWARDANSAADRPRCASFANGVVDLIETRLDAYELMHPAHTCDPSSVLHDPYDWPCPGKSAVAAFRDSGWRQFTARLAHAVCEVDYNPHLAMYIATSILRHAIISHILYKTDLGTVFLLAFEMVFMGIVVSVVLREALFELFAFLAKESARLWRDVSVAWAPVIDHLHDTM